MEQNQNRYQFQEAILSTTNGTLYHGKDLALNRNIFLYLIHKKGSTSDEECKRMLAGVSHYADPAFFHILDLGESPQGVFAAVETRDGAPLCQLIREGSLSLTFEETIKLAIQIGTSMQDALEERVHGFSLALDNIWLSGKQAMVMNYWTEGEKRQRGSIGLIHLLFQLLCATDAIPDECADMEGRLLDVLQGRGPEERERLLHLFKRAHAGQDSISFILLELNMLLRHQAQPEMESEIRPPSHDQAKTAKSAAWRKKWIPFVAILLCLIAVYLAKAWWNHSNEAAESAPMLILPKEEPSEKGLEPKDKEPLPASTEGSDQEDALTVPNLVGLPKAEAEKLALEKGLHYQFYLEPNDQEAGIVFKQDLEAGKQVPKRTQIQFWISKGP